MVGISSSHRPHFLPVRARPTEIWLLQTRLSNLPYVTDHSGYDLIPFKRNLSAATIVLEGPT
jgi:hypothetical protein